MAKSDSSTLIELVHPICCGLDVHKKAISACILTSKEGGEWEFLQEQFGTVVDDLIRLREWLLENECPVVAMESTGVYWQPVHNILEGYVEVVLVNARHARNVPGRKTDVKDSQWLASLLRHGLVRGSFIPPKEVRTWRYWTRHRKLLVRNANDWRTRVHRLLQSANIKIDSEMSDLFGRSGRNLLKRLVDKDAQVTITEVKACLKGSLQKKAERIFKAIQGFFNEHHRQVLASSLRIIEMLESEIDRVDSHLRIIQGTFQAILDRLIEVPGIGLVSARAILAEVGPTLEAFPTEAALSSWCGLAPGNNESAGKRRSGKPPVKKHWLKTIMVEVAWAAVKKKKSYYKDKYYRLKARLGSKKAIVALAHRILKAVYHIIKHGKTFNDLGDEYLAQRNEKSTLAYLTHKASQIGYKLVPIEKTDSSEPADPALSGNVQRPSKTPLFPELQPAR